MKSTTRNGMSANALKSISGLPLSGRSRLPRWMRSRRGVATVLAMMFLILFGSLAAAMAIASKGNLSTAATHLHVLRAQGAAETGLRIAQARLMEASNRFVVSESTVDSTFGTNLWTGNLSSLGSYTVLPPKSGRLDLATPPSLARAVADLHSQDQDVVTQVGIQTATIGNAQSGASTATYKTSGWVYTPAVAIEARNANSAVPPLAFQVTYAPLANGTDVRAIVTGYDYAYGRNGQPISRTVMQDFRMVKRVNHAVISPSKVMVGKNVNIIGDLGCRFTGVTYNNGDPLISRSDFKGLNPGLDAKLDLFYQQLKLYDVDGDNRLRVNHPTESLGLGAGSRDWDSNGHPYNAFSDVTGDGYVDDFDIFIKHYDHNNDGRLVLSSRLTAGTPAAGQTSEFTDDDDLALLIDSTNPDRNRNGISGFTDNNHNGYFDAGDVLLDHDAVTGSYPDQVLGYRDGIIDKKDQYAKINGRVSFKVTQAAWAAGQGDISGKVLGSIVPAAGDAPRRYGVSDSEMPDLSAANFSTDRNGLQNAADGQTFDQQVALQLGISTSQLATYVEAHPAGSTSPRFLRLDADANHDGRPDNWSTAYYEKMPYNSPNFSDYYYRPVYENMTFRDVRIPMGNNALFKSCTFIGVTYVQSYTANTHIIWSEYGKMKMDSASARPILANPRMIYGDDSGETSFPTMLSSSDRPVYMANPPLDKADIAADQVAYTNGYNRLPDPLIIASRRVVDTKAYSNNVRFHDCLFVGSIVGDAVTNYTQARNKLQFTGATKFVDKYPGHENDAAYNPDSADLAEIAKSTLMVPNTSVDIGSFNSSSDQDVRLRGAIIAGVLDIRGNATVDGALLLTFAPTLGSGPLQDANGNPLGNPAGFNMTLGYFGPADGDSESIDPMTLPVVGGQRIVGWDTNGDGLADVAADQPQPTGGVAVPFHGYGRIQVRFDPNIGLPTGVLVPMQMVPVASSYREGKL